MINFKNIVYEFLQGSNHQAKEKNLRVKFLPLAELEIGNSRDTTYK